MSRWFVGCGGWKMEQKPHPMRRQAPARAPLRALRRGFRGRARGSQALGGALKERCGSSFPRLVEDDQRRGRDHELRERKPRLLPSREELDLRKRPRGRPVRRRDGACADARRRGFTRGCQCGGSSAACLFVHCVPLEPHAPKERLDLGNGHVRPCCRLVQRRLDRPAQVQRLRLVLGEVVGDHLVVAELRDARRGLLSA